MFKVGDKVVPISKSLYSDLENSVSWKEARKMGQKFLYIARKHNDGGYSCWYDQNGIGGDHFLSSDLIPYIDMEDTTKGKKMVILSIKELNDMVNKGILSETDEFYVHRV